MAEFKIENLRKTFKIGNNYLEVLRGLELTGDTGEITVILGRSGCGKTTLLKILCGLETPDEGKINFPDNTVFGMVFQEPRLMPWLNIEGNVNFGLEKAQIDPQKTAEIIHTVKLDGFEAAYPAQLSGGMQHRVALARALACRPGLILMDEPFAALDFFTRSTMQCELLRIHRETKMGVIFVTHNIDEAIILGDRICIMAGGVITEKFYPGPLQGERDLLSSSSIKLKRNILSALEGDAKKTLKEN